MDKWLGANTIKPNKSKSIEIKYHKPLKNRFGKPVAIDIEKNSVISFNNEVK